MHDLWVVSAAIDEVVAVGANAVPTIRSLQLCRPSPVIDGSSTRHGSLSCKCRFESGFAELFSAFALSQVSLGETALEFGD